jgi:hypothetical protein
MLDRGFVERSMIRRWMPLRLTFPKNHTSAQFRDLFAISRCTMGKKRVSGPPHNIQLEAALNTTTRFPGSLRGI